jgi:hypothetical protein
LKNEVEESNETPKLIWAKNFISTCLFINTCRMKKIKLKKPFSWYLVIFFTLIVGISCRGEITFNSNKVVNYKCVSK